MYKLWQIEIEPPEFKVDSLERYWNVIQLLSELTVQMVAEYPQDINLVTYRVDQ